MSARSDADATLAARGLAHRYGSAQILAGVDLTLTPGTVTALLGPNGVGKTTLLKALAGLLRPTVGAVTLGGRDVAGLGPGELARAVAFVSRPTPLAFAWTALEVVLMGRAPHLGGRLESADDRARAQAALASLDAGHLADRVHAELSAGEQQRVLIARALCQDTPILLMDEPTSHQDPAHALAVADRCRQLAAEGRAVACVLHDLNLAARAADTLVFLAEGRVAAAGPPAETLVPEVIRRVYGVDATRVEGAVPAVILRPAGEPA